MTALLAQAQMIAGSAGTGAVINYTLMGDELTGTVDSMQKLGQGVLTTSPASLYTPAGGKSAVVRVVMLHNTSASPVTVAMYVDGTAGANQVKSFIIPANGSADWENNGWNIYDANGYRQTAGNTGPQGLQGIQGIQGVQGNPGTPGSNGVITTINTAVPLTGGGSAATLNLAINAATTIAAGTMSAADKVKIDAIIGANSGDVSLTAVGASPNANGASLSGQALTLQPASTTQPGLLSASDKRIIDSLHYDMVADFGWVGNDSTDNLSLWATAKSTAPTGAILFFPAGTYRISGELTIDVDKRFAFRGVGRYTSIVKTTSATANIFHKSVAGWYDTWMDMGFQSSVTKTAGAAIRISAGNNVGMNCYRLWITGIFRGIEAVGSQSANLSVWADLDISGIPNGGRGLIINGDTINVMIHNATINAGAATTSACCEIDQSGAVQVTACDWIQGTNVLWIKSDEASGAGPQACYFTNCFFDQPQGSVIKITGARTANRIKFTQCGIAPTGNNHGIEFNGTGVGAVGTATALPAGVSIVDCDIYSQNGTNTGAGIMLNGVGDVNIQNNRIAGFNGVGGCGISVIPSAGNQTKVRINGNILGPNSNLTVTNETGVKLVAGSSALGFLSITDNSMLGCGTAINDASTILATATKNIRDNQGAANGLQATTTAGDTYTTTVEKVIMQVYVPPNGFKVGTSIQGLWGALPGATTITETEIRIGTAGTVADACFVKIVGPATSPTSVWCAITAIVTAVGGSAAITGGGSIQNVLVAGTITTGGTFNSAVGNFVSVTARSSATNTASIRGGQMTVFGPA